MALSISSPAFSAGGSIPATFTCEGQDISPELIPSLNPDVVIVPRQFGAASNATDPRESLLGDPIWQSILSDGRVKVIDLPQAQLTAISHHVVKSAVGLGHALHPERVPPTLPVIEQAPFVQRQ